MTLDRKIPILFIVKVEKNKSIAYYLDENENL